MFMTKQPTDSNMLDDILADQFCDDNDSDSDFDMLHDFDVDAILATVDKYDVNNWLLLWGNYTPLSSTHCYTLSTLSNTLMFIKRSSSAIHCISTDFFNGVVDVMFNNGSVYHYTNVSRRAIANLQLQPNMSLGFWVNNNLLNAERVLGVKRYDAIPTVWY